MFLGLILSISAGEKSKEVEQCSCDLVENVFSRGALDFPIPGGSVGFFFPLLGALLTVYEIILRRDLIWPTVARSP